MTHPTRPSRLAATLAFAIFSLLSVLGASTVLSASPPTVARGILLQPINVWVLPRFVVEQTAFVDVTTLWAVRNEDNGPVRVDITYRNTIGDEIGTDNFLLAERQTMTRSMRDLDGFPGPTGFVDGSIWFRARRTANLAAEDGRISIDSFTVDASSDFANGGTVHKLSESCRNWSARFLNFGSGPTSIDVLTEALGSTFAPVTLTVYLYEQDGTFITVFEVFSDHDAFTIDLAAHTNKSFGVAELDFGDGRWGVVSSRHSAFGRFSVGHEAYCADQ